MTCANCAANIERGLKKLKGIKEASVSFASEQVSVTYETGDISLRDITDKINGLGYRVITSKIELPVTGMTCANCAMNIERVLNRKVPGILSAAVNFAVEHVSVEYVPSVSSVEDIILAIKKAGYGAIAPDMSSDEHDFELEARNAEIKNQTRKIFYGLFFTIPLFLSKHGKRFPSYRHVEPCTLGKLALFRPCHSCPVLHGMGLLCRRV